MDCPGIQLAKGDFQKHAVKGRDQIYVLQTVEQRLSAKEGQNKETSNFDPNKLHSSTKSTKKYTSVISIQT